MILTTYDKDLYEKTLKEDAREEGREEGRAEIIAELNQLTKYLLKAKRYSDLERATEDIEFFRLFYVGLHQILLILSVQRILPSEELLLKRKIHPFIK